jgi:hypothetical protein
MFFVLDVVLLPLLIKFFLALNASTWLQQNQ